MGFDVKGKVAIVTGSARGFGKEFAERLLRKGAKVCISDVIEDIGKETVNELKSKFGTENVIFQRLNVCDRNEWETAWKCVEETFGQKVQILINNAGLKAACGWKFCLEVNLYGAMIGSFLARDQMGKTKGGSGGRIINIASMAGLGPGMTGFEGLGYPVSKCGMISFTRSYAKCSEPRPWEDDGIKAYALCPWFADTDMIKGTNDTYQKRREKLYNYFRVLSVEDVGSAFEQVLEADDNGGIFVAFPDVPIIKFPDFNEIFLIPLITIAKLIFLLGPTRSWIKGSYIICILFFLTFFLFHIFISLINYL